MSSAPSSVGAPIRSKPEFVWDRGGQRPAPYQGFDFDSDLWLETGDCLVYFKDTTDESQSPLMLRLHVREIEKAESTFLSNLLRYGEIERDNTPPGGVQSYNGFSPLTQSNLGYFSDREGSSGYESGEDRTSSASPPIQRRPVKNFSRSSSDQIPPPPQRLGVLPTPPASTIVSDEASMVSSRFYQRQEPDITHEIWLPTPSTIKSKHAARRHQLAMRNFFAIMYDRPIIGGDYFEMLTDLEYVMYTIYELDGPRQRGQIVRKMVHYITNRKLDNVSGDLKSALGLLAWCEKDSVRWQGGYLETFVHCVGMMVFPIGHRAPSEEVHETPEFRRLTAVTRHMLQDAETSMKLKVLSAEERLARFDFASMWSEYSNAGNEDVKKSFVAFQGFLTSFYQLSFNAWPPSNKSYWLQRAITRRLQEDFGALYEYIVDRNIVFDGVEERAGQKWEIRHRELNPNFDPDTPALPYTEMLLRFDMERNLHHLPSPYPLLPTVSPSLTKAAKKKAFFGMKKDKTVAQIDPKEQLQLGVAYREATNTLKLRTSFKGSDLIDRFVQYEKDAALGVSPHDARLGRWMLLYCVLQTLSILSTDVQGLKYADVDKYLLNASLKGCPPWKTDVRNRLVDPRQEDSFVWQAVKRWEENQTTVSELEDPEAADHLSSERRIAIQEEFEESRFSRTVLQKRPSRSNLNQRQQSYESDQRFSPPLHPPPSRGLPTYPSAPSMIDEHHYVDTQQISHTMRDYHPRDPPSRHTEPHDHGRLQRMPQSYRSEDYSGKVPDFPDRNLGRGGTVTSSNSGSSGGHGSNSRPAAAPPNPLVPNRDPRRAALPNRGLAVPPGRRGVPMPPGADEESFYDDRRDTISSAHSP